MLLSVLEISVAIIVVHTYIRKSHTGQLCMTAVGK